MKKTGNTASSAGKNIRGHMLKEHLRRYSMCFLTLVLYFLFEHYKIVKSMVRLFLGPSEELENPSEIEDWNW